MCKILTIIGIGLFLCGCAESEPIPETVISSKEDLDKNKSSKPSSVRKKYYSGCKLLASGYLVCPKVRR